MRYFIILIFLNLSYQKSFAKDFGTRGATFVILEEGFIKMIDKRLKKIDLLKEQEKIKAKIQKKIHRPAVTNVITRAKSMRTFLYDPTFKLNQEIKLPNGQIVYPKGYTVNPLILTPLDKKLIFIDSDDQIQLDWIQKTNLAQKDLVILVNGEPNKVSQILERTVYFDQHSQMTNKFGIKHVPAILQQEGNLIRVEECAI